MAELLKGCERTEDLLGDTGLMKELKVRAGRGARVARPGAGALYPIVIFDALRVKIRDSDSRMVKNKAVYVALGVSRDGVREVLGLWIAENEGAKFWLLVMSELKNRGVQDILIAVVDGPKGFPEAITAAFPDAMVQTCIVHQVRHSLNFCAWKDRKFVAADLRRNYRAATADQAAAELDAFEEKWAEKYASIASTWQRAMARSDAVLRLRSGNPENHSHHGCHRKLEPGDPQNDQNTQFVPDRGRRDQADLLGDPKLRERCPECPTTVCRPQPIRYHA